MKKKTVAVCMANIDEQYNDVFLHRFRKFAEENDINLLYFYSFSAFYFMDSHDIGERKIYRLINYDILDALVIFPVTILDDDILTGIVNDANQKGIPVIAIDRELEGCISVCIDDLEAIYKITSHMIEEHHVKNINFIAGCKGESCSEARIEAYKRALQDHNLEVDERRIDYGDFWNGPTLEAMQRFVDSGIPMPEAVVCANDVMALAVEEFLEQRGFQVPEDIMITGYDGIPEAVNHQPHIATAGRDITEVTRQVFDILKELFDGKTFPDNYIHKIDANLQLYGSCGCERETVKNQNALVHSLCLWQAEMKYFMMDQIRMSASLTKATNFAEVFDGIMQSTAKLNNEYIMICIVDNFMDEEEFSDIVESSMAQHTGYSSRMNRVLYRKHGVWQGMIDYNTNDLLPDLDEILDDCGSLCFFPLHIHAQTVGYAVISIDEDTADIIRYYEFFLNVCNALDMSKTQRRQQTIIENLENKYVHDPLTGLFNRRGFYMNIKSDFEKCVEEQQKFKLLSVDLNGLKVINDTYGHADGDIAISTIAKALQASGGTNDCCARFGGDEFIVAGPENDNDTGELLIEKVHRYLDEFNASSGKPYQVDASIGLVSLKPDRSISLEEIIKEADERMYREKVKYHKQRQ